MLTYAQTAEELKQVLISDLRYRIEILERQRKNFARGATGKARFDSRIDELETLLKDWMDLEIRSLAKPRPKAKTESQNP